MIALYVLVTLLLLALLVSLVYMFQEKIQLKERVFYAMVSAVDIAIVVLLIWRLM